MDSNKKTARMAGLVYLFVVLTGLISLAYVPSQLIVWGDAATTVSNIVASEFLFRIGIVSGLFCYIGFMLLPLILYKLLQQVNKTHATLMVIFALIGVPISYFNLIAKFDVLTLLSGADYLNVFETAQLNAQVMLLLKSYNNGIMVVQLFWGLWLFPFGYLVFKSGFLPKFLGVLLMMGCFGYVINFLGYSLFPDSYRGSIIAENATLPAHIGEIGTCLWLLIMGAKEKENQ